MKQLMINMAGDTSITMLLESNTITPGSYINAEYNVPEDYKIKQIEGIINTYDNQRLAVKNQTNYITNTKIISTYDDINEHFKEDSTKYFVTGTTNSKFTLISKYFNKDNFINKL